MKKLSFLLSVILILSSLLVSCSDGGDDGAPVSPAGNYLYEGEGFGGDFRIAIAEDGTFTYYEGMFSSYIGAGEWTLDGDVLRLKDHENGNLKYDNYFRVEDSRLVFIEEGSTNFMYLKVADGAAFNKE